MPSLFGSTAARSTLAGARDRASSDQASHYELGYSAGRVHLQARFLDVGSRFSAVSQARDEEEAKLLAGAAGTQNTQFKGVWSLAPGASLTSQRAALRNDKLGDSNRGLTTTDTSHNLVMALGASSRLQASLTEHGEAWDRALGKPDSQRRTGKVEFATQFGRGGGSDLRLALSSTRAREGETERSEAAREVHLNLVPAARLRLTADYLAKRAGQGQEQRTQSLGAVLQLAPSSQLTATFKGVAGESAGRTREAALRLNTALGGGDTAGQLTAERRVVRAAAGPKQFTSWEMTGGVGAGPGRTNLRASVQEERGQAPEGALARTARWHADRAFRRLRLTVDREQKLTGTRQQAEAKVTSSYGLAADLSARTRMSAQLTSQRDGRGLQQSAREVAWEHQARAFRLRAQQQVGREAGQRRTASRYSLDLPGGQLPEWAKDITHGHQFPEAREYLAPREPNWLDMPFAGFRLWQKRFRGGPDSGVRSQGWAHRMMITDRYHLQVACQGRPEAEEGETKGRPLAVRRRLVEIAALLSGGLIAHGRYTGEESLAAGESRWHDVALGLRGRLSQQEELEASLSRGAGTLGDRPRNRTSVSLMYARRVDDEHQVSVKGGVAWGQEQAPVERQAREYRVSVGYCKPI